MGRPKGSTGKDNQAKEVTVTVIAKVVGRNKVVVQPSEVFKLAAIGCKDHEIAKWFGIDDNTLRLNFSHELMSGFETLKQSMRRKQIEVAMAGDRTMLIWLGKNLLSQTDVPINTDDNQILPWENEIANTSTTLS